jgi:hypothetical protein
MIERWISLPHSSACCIQLEGDGKVNDKLWWAPPKKGCSMLVPSMVS